MFLFLTSLATPERIARLKQILEGTSHLQLRVFTGLEETGQRECVYVETPWNALLSNEDFVQTVLRLLAEAA